MAEQVKVTLDQAAAALQQLSEESGKALPKDDDRTLAVEAEPSGGEIKPEETALTVEAGEAVETEGDDVESLKKRLEEREANHAHQEKLFQARWQAFKSRQTQSEGILRERMLRKSTAADRALKILKATRTEQGVSEAEVDRVIQEIEGTMNPASASYVPPASASNVLLNEDQAIVLNDFLNEKGMTTEESEEFGKWVRTDGGTALSLTEQAVAGQSLDGFLRIAHGRWQEGMKESDKDARRMDAVNAVRAVQRTQKEAARAASASPTAPHKQPAGSKSEIDVKKLQPDDISALLRQSVEQYR